MLYLLYGLKELTNTGKLADRQSRLDPTLIEAEFATEG